MRALFVFDTVLLKENENYYGMTLTYEFFKKMYLNYYSQITVTTRVKKRDNYKGNSDGYKIVNGENVNVLPIYNYKKIPDAFINKKNIISELKEIIENVDLVIVRMPSVLGIFTCEICKKINKKYLVEVVACAWDGYINHTNPIGKLVAPIMYIKNRICIKSAPNVLYVTNNFLQSRYPTFGKQVSCSDVNINNFDNKVLESRIKNIKKIKDKEEIKLCTVANVEMKYKGHEYVIKALSKINSKEHKYKYYLIGNGKENRLKNIAKKNHVEKDVIFLGSLSHDDVLNQLDQIDIYIQPSLQEGLPRAMIEAMSRGCPIIASNAGGIPELLNEDDIFHKKDVKELLKKLNELDENKLLEMAKRNFFNSKKYTWDNLCKIRKEFYI